MKWLVVKMLMVVAIVFGLFNYVTYLKTGQSPLSQLDFSLPSVADLKSSIPDVDLPDVSLPEMGGDSGQPITVYKWVDENGVINYSQSDPNIAHAEAMVVHPDTNLVQADPLPEPEPEPQKPEPVQQPAPEVSLMPSPASVQKLMQDAQNVQTLMDERTHNLEQALDGARK